MHESWVKPPCDGGEGCDVERYCKIQRQEDGGDVMLRDIVRFSVRKIQRQEDGGASVVRFSVRKMEVHLSVPVPPGGA